MDLAYKLASILTPVLTGFVLWGLNRSGKKNDQREEKIDLAEARAEKNNKELKDTVSKIGEFQQESAIKVGRIEIKVENHEKRLDQMTGKQ